MINHLRTPYVVHPLIKMILIWTWQENWTLENAFVDANILLISIYIASN
jgi:hypothetical protein